MLDIARPAEPGDLRGTALRLMTAWSAIEAASGRAAARPWSVT